MQGSFTLTYFASGKPFLLILKWSLLFVFMFMRALLSLPKRKCLHLEECIHKEFGSFQLTSCTSKVLDETIHSTSSVFHLEERDVQTYL